MISARFAPLVCALVGLALVPTFIHSYADSTIVDGRTTEDIPASLAGYSSTPSGRNAGWGKRRFDSDDWTERVYDDGKSKVTLTVVRSYDPKALYHHPELAVAYGTTFVRGDVRRFPQRLTIPVHMLYSGRDDGPIAMYVLHYDDRFVQDPILFQIRAAGELLLSGRKAMTLFFMTDTRDQTSATAADGPPTADLLFAAIESFVSGSDGPAK